MPFAWALADFADRSENGAMPPGVWQPAHFSAKIGATRFHVGAAVGAAADLPPEPAAMATTPAPIPAAAASTRPSLLRFTAQSYRVCKAKVSADWTSPIYGLVCCR